MIDDLLKSSALEHIPWVPWTDKSVAYKSSRSGEGAGEKRLMHELRILGVSVSSIAKNADYDLKTELGTIEVKAPDSNGRIVTAGLGHKVLAPFIAECVGIIRLLDPVTAAMDDDFRMGINEIQGKLERGNFSEHTLAAMLDVIELMKDTYGPWSSVRHRWIVDPSVFISDIIVFPSECIAGDHIALVCEEGYALLTKLDSDNLLRFQGDAWGGRPKFQSELASQKNRQEKIENTPHNRHDKIAATQRLKKNPIRKA